VTSNFLAIPLTPAQLQALDCLALDNTTGKQYSLPQINEQLALLPHWQYKDGFIERQYKLSNYRQNIAFVNLLATMFDAQDHHPEMLLTYAVCLVKLNTHSVNGISVNDFICAARADLFFEQVSK
jgi:4a-hydroxytetrahydrobiopterin dehydratase